MFNNYPYIYDFIVVNQPDCMEKKEEKSEISIWYRCFIHRFCRMFCLFLYLKKEVLEKEIFDKL
jgi:hypothetical protein